MPRLSNKKHEAFAKLIAGGEGQTDAYELVYARREKSHASRLANDGRVKERVRELRGLGEAAQVQLPAAPVPVDNLPTDREPTLAELGYNRRWFADSYRALYERAVALDKSADAVRALSSIYKMYESDVEKEAAEADSRPAQRIDIDALGGILGKVADIVAASKQADQSADGEQVLKVRSVAKDQDE